MTLRQFPCRDLARAKKKINDVIFELEMEILHGESAQPLASCVVHNYCLLKDDFDKGYLLDNNDDDNDDGGSHGSDANDGSTPGSQDGL